MNYFHVFGKGRKEGKPSRQSSSQSECEEWGEIEASERGSGHFFKSFPLSASIQSAQLHAGIMQISQFSPLSSAAVAE